MNYMEGGHYPAVQEMKRRISVATDGGDARVLAQRPSSITGRLADLEKELSMLDETASEITTRLMNAGVLAESQGQPALNDPHPPPVSDMDTKLLGAILSVEGIRSRLNELLRAITL